MHATAQFRITAQQRKTAAKYAQGMNVGDVFIASTSLSSQYEDIKLFKYKGTGDVKDIQNYDRLITIRRDQFANLFTNRQSVFHVVEM